MSNSDTFRRGEQKAASTLRDILSFWKGTHYLPSNTSPETPPRQRHWPSSSAKIFFHRQSQRLLQTSWVLTRKKILFVFALNRGNPPNAGILTNFYKEFIYVYCILCAGLYKDGMNGVGVVLRISLHDFSGRQQLLIRGSALKTFPSFHPVQKDTGSAETWAQTVFPATQFLWQEFLQPLHPKQSKAKQNKVLALGIRCGTLKLSIKCTFWIQLLCVIAAWEATISDNVMCDTTNVWVNYTPVYM